MYLDGHLDRFRGLNKLTIAADRSSYAGEKTMVGIIWSLEAKTAFFGPVQIIPSSTLLSPADMGDVSDRLKAPEVGTNICLQRAASTLAFAIARNGALLAGFPHQS